ncbi:26S proteasome non-ATPase regulatory subunit 5 [Desmophyllum pertusum]|uniref:26S proteasome non-ATPase regulatory subunit 5 n=1 Tax=Desmophyllum pertusum TaxID=174260 RepID=A0A9W9YZE7_9CNID|nr:26S proteasome non-ATPase regulatory subunit 5 [Desmophyllum pertusum]
MSLMLPSIIRFFGYLAQSRPAEVTQQYPAFLQNVFSFLTAGDPALKLIAIQTIGVVAHSEPGLRVIFDNKSRNDETMKILCTDINSSEADVKGRTLEALALIFHSPDVPSEDLSSLTGSLFSAMASNPLQILIEVSKQPFQDVHCAALKVFRSLAKYRWAQEDMTTCPGFLEYLLDRKTETDKAGKELKYGLIAELVRSPFSKEVFDKPFHLRLREYEREGPFYVQAQAAVAFEGAD